jgi:hypothetical protein
LGRWRSQDAILIVGAAPSLALPGKGQLQGVMFATPLCAPRLLPYLAWASPVVNPSRFSFGTFLGQALFEMKTGC